MVLAIENALQKWRHDKQIALVIIDATGEKAFCAGGDIQKLYDTGMKGEYHFMRKFWADEYRLNAMIANYPKPYVAFMDGIVMGGGVGVSAHGSHRIVTPRTILAMPECAIGLVPDVGGSFLLAQSPGNVGLFMGVTGARMDGPSAIFAGFADTLIEIDDIDKLKNELISSGDTGIIKQYARPAQLSALEENLEMIDRFFSANTPLSATLALETDENEWASTQAKLIRRACPLSVACTWQMVKAAHTFGSIEQALKLEYRFTWRSMDEGDVLEGTRALIVDKDRKPDWKIKRLEDVTQDAVSSMLAPLGNDELNVELLK